MKHGSKEEGPAHDGLVLLKQAVDERLHDVSQAFEGRLGAFERVLVRDLYGDQLPGVHRKA